MKGHPMSIDPEVFGKAMGQIIREALQPIQKRLAALEENRVTKSLDADVTDELASLIERVDQLQAEVAEKGFTNRGYWREGIRAKRNDCYSNDGSFWIALRDTGDRPMKESPDWMVIARKGRDAR